MKPTEIYSFLSYLQSQQTAQAYLRHCYRKLPEVDAEKKSYENANAFLYYLAHGKQFYENGQKLDLLLQPLLYFYGMVHLLKACLLTVRPDYPESTTVLAHGVSARKRKKKNYTFFQDEVRIQHNGLFPYVIKHLFGFKKMPFEKSDMALLLGLIPEISPIFNWHQQKTLVPVGKVNEAMLCFPFELLDGYHLTKHAFMQKVQHYFPGKDAFSYRTENDMLMVKTAGAIDESQTPFFFDTAGDIYFPASRENCLAIPEAAAHYLILYNLSMLSRYEAEWWGELLIVKPDIDYPLIEQFLQITARKMPFYLGRQLYRRFND